MSETTNLKLKKHDDVLESTNAFNIEEYLNDNWDKIDENIEQINEKIKQNSNNIESLQTDNTTNKKSIEELKQKNAEQDESIKTNASKIEELRQENIEIKAENERLRDDIKSIALIGEESGESIDLEDSSEARFNKFEILGNHKQDEESTLDNPVEIKVVKDNINEVICNKNYIDNDNTSKTIAGVSFIKNEDGSILVNGTATENVSYPIQSKFKKYEDGEYFLSGCPAGGSSSSFGMILWNENWVSLVSDYGNGRKVTLTAQKAKLHLSVKAGTVCNNLLFKPQFEKNSKATTYSKHQSQTVIMPVQQEMLEGDYFDWENEKQTNLFEKIVLDGVDKKCITSKAVGDGSEFQWSFTVEQSLSYARAIYSNVAKLASDFNTLNGVRISANSRTAYVRSKIEVLNGKEATSENVNELLKTMYNNGNPAIFYIEKASNRELDFTDEQKAIAKQIKQTLHTYKNITHIYSEDEISPKINIEYVKDLNTVINNIQAQIINNASEEV